MVGQSAANLMEMIHPFGETFQEIIQCAYFLGGLFDQIFQPVKERRSITDSPGFVRAKGRVNARNHSIVLANLFMILR